MTAGLDQHLLFVAGAPRSGTTLILRLLHAHPDVLARPEAHLLTPLAHLGYFARVDAAPYDPIQSHRAARALVADLPDGEQGYLLALRAYSDTLYRQLMATSEARILVDKTPAYALILPFVHRLYPAARKWVVTRHPFAVFSSFAQTFFDDDWQAAHRHNPIVERYVPAMGSYLRDHQDDPAVRRVRYEDLVSDPESVCRSLCAHLDLPFHPPMLAYGAVPMDQRGLGDPWVQHASAPHRSSVARWTDALVGRPEREALLRRMVSRVDDADLVAIGHPRETLWQPLHEPTNRAPRRQRLDTYRVQRRVLRHLRSTVHHHDRLGRALTRVRLACDVLLRE